MYHGFKILILTCTKVFREGLGHLGSISSDYIGIDYSFFCIFMFSPEFSVPVLNDRARICS